MLPQLEADHGCVSGKLRSPPRRYGSAFLWDGETSGDRQRAAYATPPSDGWKGYGERSVTDMDALRQARVTFALSIATTVIVPIM
jgi:hypothetical protein